MSARIFRAVRLPINTASLAGKRVPATVRYNSNRTSDRTSSKIAEIASQTQKPDLLNITVPLMWAASGGLICTAFFRVDDKSASAAEDVRKLNII